MPPVRILIDLDQELVKKMILLRDSVDWGEVIIEAIETRIKIETLKAVKSTETRQ